MGDVLRPAKGILGICERPELQLANTFCHNAIDQDLIEGVGSGFKKFHPPFYDRKAKLILACGNTKNAVINHDLPVDGWVCIPQRIGGIE